MEQGPQSLQGPTPMSLDHLKVTCHDQAPVIGAPTLGREGIGKHGITRLMIPSNELQGTEGGATFGGNCEGRQTRA